MIRSCIRQPRLDYATLRDLHATCAVINVGLFAARGAMQLAGMDWRRRQWLRFAPHVNDTVLLGAALALAWASGQYPLARPWLTAKVLALCAYVALGRLALLPRPAPASRRLACYLAALACVAYIVGVALTRSAALGIA